MNTLNSLSNIIKITTPYAKRGVAWEEFTRRAELDFAVWQVSTAELNPTIPAEGLEKARTENIEQFSREYKAEFTDSLVSWLEPESLMPCIVKGRTELPRIDGVMYASCIDPAFRQSDFAMAISHRTEEGFIVLDFLKQWCGSKRAPLGFERVCREVAEILGSYQIATVTGDQFAAPAIESELGQMGISYDEMVFGRSTRAKLFNNLKHLILQQRVELIDDPELLRQLRSLEEERSPDGNIDVRPAQGKDDAAVVIAMSAFVLSEVSRPFVTPIIFGRASRPWDGCLPSRHRIDDLYPVGQNCGKFPNCFESDDCECYGLSKT